MVKIVDRSVLVCALVYFLLGIFGYLSYFQNMPPLVIQRPSLTGGIDWFMVVGKAILCVSLLGSVLLANNPLRTEIEKICNCGNRKRRPWLYYLITFGIMFFISGFAILFSDVIGYLKFIGGISAVPLTLVIPALVYFKLSENTFKIILVVSWSIILTVVGYISPIRTILGY